MHARTWVKRLTRLGRVGRARARVVYPGSRGRRRRGPLAGERRDGVGYQLIASTPSGPMAAEAVTDAVMADVRVLAAEHGFSGPELALDNIGDQLVIAPPDAEAMEEALARAMKSVPDTEAEEDVLDRMTVHRLRYVLRSGAECDDCEILLVRVGQFKAGG